MKFLPYERYKPSGIEWLGDVPEHWGIDRLRRSSQRVTDGAHISPDLSSPDFPFVSTVDLWGGKIDFEGCLRTSDECYTYLVHTGCRPHHGDLLFSKDGTVGRTAVVDVDRLIVAEATVGKTLMMKRFHARGRGRGAKIEKKISNMTIVVREAEEEPMDEKVLKVKRG